MLYYIFALAASVESGLRYNTDLRVQLQLQSFNRRQSPLITNAVCNEPVKTGVKRRAGSAGNRNISAEAPVANRGPRLGG